MIFVIESTCIRFYRKLIPIRIDRLWNIHIVVAFRPLCIENNTAGMIRSAKRSNRLSVKLLIIIPAGKFISRFCDLLRSRKFCHRLIVIRRSRVTFRKRSSIFLIVNAGFLPHIRPLGRSFLRLRNRILRIRVFGKCCNRH